MAHVLGFVVKGVELSLLERVSNLFEKNSNSFTITQLLEVCLGDTKLSSSGGVHQVNSLWLVTVVLIVSNRAPNLEGYISADSWYTKAAVLITCNANGI